jgi:hypothetical protein
MTYEDALQRAHDYFTSHPFPYPDYRWSPSEGLPLAGGLYFKHCVEHVCGVPPEQCEAFAAHQASW